MALLDETNKTINAAIVVVNLWKISSGNFGKKDSTVMIDRLLLEKIPLAGIARVLKLSESWLQGYVNQCYKEVPRHVQVTPKPKGALRVQMDELWSFVNDKGNKQWVWLALDVDTREIVGCHIGDRSADSALSLWQSMPAVYRQCAMIYTDYWNAYQAASLNLVA